MINATNLLIAIVAVAFIINLLVEVEKKLLPNAPTNILTFVSAIVVTILAAVAYITYAKVAVTVALVIGIAAGCIAEAYIAMFGYDKFKQTIEQFKGYTD